MGSEELRNMILVNFNCISDQVVQIIKNVCKELDFFPLQWKLMVLS